MTRETDRSRSDIEARFRERQPLTVRHTAPTLADLWAKVSQECITQEAHGLRVVQVTAEISFEDESK